MKLGTAALRRARRRCVARSLRHRGVAQLRLGRYAEAEKDLRRALELSKIHGNRLDVARALGSIGVVLEMTGQFAEGRRAALEVLETARELGDLRMLWIGDHQPGRG
jgi:tetratricopeptide (TPR) repeat protein